VTNYVVSPRAQRDIEGIWDYTAERWNLPQAEIYIRGVWAAIQTIAADPRVGRSADDVRPGYRRYPIGSHVIFYRMTADGMIDVVRVLHSHMDFDGHL
jgi:toxin ParE1/3/4